MNYIISADTDIGLTKSTNQDSLSVKVIQTPSGRMAFAVLCDGMGGLAEGEVASASVIRAFHDWALNELSVLANGQIEDYQIREQWERIVKDQNDRIKNYGAGRGIRLGTTVVALLLTQSRYYVLNVGDSRVYELTDTLRQLTNDQTFVAREVAMGRMTEEEAEQDQRRSVLLQCVGASEEVFPDFFFGEPKVNAVYLLCSDGFRHEISGDEIYQALQPAAMTDENSMYQNCRSLIELNKQRSERDNISVAVIRTF